MNDAPARGSRLSAPSFDPQATRAGLRELDLGGLSVVSTEEQRYLVYYGLDLAGVVPDVVHHFGKLAAAGFTIASHFYAAPRPRGTCVLMHGYFDHAGLYRHLIAHCLRRGYSVLIWDLPGHGLSSGEQASIHSFEVYVDVLVAMIEHYGTGLRRPLIGIGQSTGAAILMSYAMRKARAAEPLPLERLILLAPLVRPADWFKVGLSFQLARLFRKHIARRFMHNSGDGDFLDFVQRDPLQSRILPVRWVAAMRQWVRDFLAQPAIPCALLVIQGDADGTVDWKWNLARIRERFPSARLTMVPGARHQLVNEAPALREQVFAAMGLE